MNSMEILRAAIMGSSPFWAEQKEASQSAKLKAASSNKQVSASQSKAKSLK